MASRHLSEGGQGSQTLLQSRNPYLGMLPRLPPTRDTSQVAHHVKLPAWLEDLDKAIRDAGDTRVKDYSTASALLLSWKDTDMKHGAAEITRFGSVLERCYGAAVEHWEIPSKDADSALYEKVPQAVKKFGAQDLLIVYYAGHARPGSPPGSPPVWYAEYVSILFQKPQRSSCNLVLY